MIEGYCELSYGTGCFIKEYFYPEHFTFVQQGLR
jgi:hypothetical protein